MFEDKIRAGIAFLDEEVPQWEEKINPERIDVSKGFACVLGQIFGSYLVGIAHLWPELTLNERDREAEKYGFWLADEKYDDEDIFSLSEAYSILSDEWCEILSNLAQD